MKTGKEITQIELDEALNSQVYSKLFNKKNAMLFLNTCPITKRAWFSVMELTSFEETYFDSLTDAVKLYNTL